MGTKVGPKGTSMIQVSPGNFVPVSNFAGSITATAPRGGIGGGITLPASVNMGGMGGVGGSGGDAGGDAVTVADILNLPKVLTDEEKFQKAEEELAAAAERLADFQAMKGSAYGLGTTEEDDEADQYFTRQAELQAELEQARENYIALGGDPNPSFLSKVGQGALDFIGGTGQVLSDLATLGTGPEVAQTLLDPVSILLGGLGGTINYSQSGKTTPLILGQTSSGMPVGLNIPDPRSVLEGGLPTLIPGAAAAASTAGALSVSGNEEGQDQVKSGVGVTPAGALTAAAATDDDDTVKVNKVVRGDDAIVTGVKDPVIKDVIDPNKVPITVDAGDAIGPVQEITGDFGPAIGPILTTITDDPEPPETPETPEDILFTLGEQQFEDVIETTVTPAELLAILGAENTDTITTRTAPTLTAALSGSSEASSGGASSLLVPQQRVVQVDPRGVVDIEYLYDFEKGLDQPFEAFEEEEDELLKVAEGGQVKKFNNGGSVNPYAAGLAVLGGIFGANQNSGLNQPQGYQGGIPNYTATRTLQPDAFSQTTTDPATGETVARRPGSMGRRYFSDVTFTPVAEAGLPAVADQSQDQDDTVAEDGTTATLSDLIGSTGLANLLSSLGLGGTSASGTFIPGTSTSSTVTSGTPTSSTFTPSEEVTNTTRQAISNPLNDFFAARGFTTDEERPVTQDDLNAAITAGFTVDELAAGLGTSTDAIQAILDYQYEEGGTVMFDQLGRTNPPPGEFITEVSTKNPMGPPDPASDEFLQLIESLDRERYKKSTRTIPELLRDLFEDYGYATPRQHAGTLQRMRFNKENPDFLDQLEAMKEARERVLDAEEYATGGMAQGQGYYLGGATDGMADLIPATIDGTQPAALSDGEFVIPADVVSHLGNGNSDAGAKQLYSMMDRVRTERTGTTKQGPEIDPTKMMPA